MGKIPNQRGLTLFEILIVMGIVALVALLAVPGMRGAMEGGQRAAGINDVMNMISYARAQAVARQASVSLCPSADATTCAGTDWEDGWILFVDDGAGGGTELDGNRDGTEEILRVGDASVGTVSIRSHNFADAGALRFDELGMAAERGTLMVCDGGGKEEAMGVVLNISGQPRLATDDADDDACPGCIEKDNGAEATCP